MPTVNFCQQSICTCYFNTLPQGQNYCMLIYNTQTVNNNMKQTHCLRNCDTRRIRANTSLWLTHNHHDHLITQSATHAVRLVATHAAEHISASLVDTRQMIITMIPKHIQLMTRQSTTHAVKLVATHAAEHISSNSVDTQQCRSPQ
jgi:hypothetical protein